MRRARLAMLPFAGALAALLAGGPAAETAGVRFAHHVVDAEGPLDVWLKTVGDLNGDGKPDLVAGGVTEGGLIWYENPSWRKHAIAAGHWGTDGEPADIDRDGDLDLAVIGEKPPALLWLENPGWKAHPIAGERLHDVEVADLDGDGDLDLAARNQGSFSAKGDALHFYRQDPAGRWTHGTLAIADGEGLVLADLDGDGDADAVTGRTWYENTGDPLARRWPAHEYGPEWSHPHTFVAPGRVNADGRPDIALVPAERAGGTYRISWFEAPRDPKAGAWRERVVDAPVETVHHFAGIADFDGDGLGDIATAEMHQGEDPDEVKIYLNAGAGETWRKVVLSTTGSHSMRIADLDGDGDMDLYGANWRGRAVEWWENLRK